MSRPHPRRPVLFGPAAFDALPGDADPEERVATAHATAAALVGCGHRGADAEATGRLVRFADEHGIEHLAELWSQRPADSLPGALWRIYALRAGIQQDPVGMARAFDSGRHRAQVDEVVAGVADPPSPDDVRRLADAVLTGAFAGDFAVALERAGAFCRVVATGWSLIADELDGERQPEAGYRLTRRAGDLARTGVQLEQAAQQWRAGHLA